MYRWSDHGIMGRRFTDGGLLRCRKWVPQELGDVNKQGSRDSRPIGVWHGVTAANHTDLQSGCGRPCVFEVRVWSNLWDLIWLRTSHYSMGPMLCRMFRDLEFKSCEPLHRYLLLEIIKCSSSLHQWDISASWTSFPALPILRIKN